MIRSPHLFAAVLLALPRLVAQSPTDLCYERDLGTDLGLGAFQVVAQPLGFTFPGPAGPVSTVNVSPNGFVYLDSNTYAAPGVILSRFFGGSPRICAAWTQLDAGPNGAVFHRTISAAAGRPARAVFTWHRVREAGTDHEFTVQLQLLADGAIKIHFGLGTDIELPILTGVTQGLQGTQWASGPNLDWTTLDNGPIDSGSNPTVYEVFPRGKFDLPNRTFTLTPNGAGGYVLARQFGCADLGLFGTSCPREPTVYEYFPLGQTGGSLDLSNQSIDFTPNGYGGWTVTACRSACFFTGYANNLGIVGEQVVRGLALPFPFTHPGGSTTAIDVSDNGYVYLVSGTIASARGKLADPRPEFFADTASIAALGMHLEPFWGGGVYYDVDPAGNAVHVTWAGIAEARTGGLNVTTSQCTLFADGSFRLSYGKVTNTTTNVIVGYSRGRSSDPGPDDLTALPFDTGTAGTPVYLVSKDGGTPQIGFTFEMTVHDVPPGAAAVVMLFGLPLAKPIDLLAAGMPGCLLHVTPFADSAFSAIAPVTTTALAIPPDPALLGIAVGTQAAVVAAGTTPVGVVTTNGARLVLGY